MKIAGIERFSTIDWPGMLSAVIFTSGCPWNCWYCHNREIISGAACIPENEVLQFLARRKGRLDGVVVSGGEPTAQPDLVDLMRRLRTIGYRIKLDTNGSAPDAVQALIDKGLLDYAAVDLKGPPEQYGAIGCGPASSVLETVQLLRASSTDFEVRTTVLPGNGHDELRAICDFIGPVPLYVLQVYRYNGRPMMSRKALEALAETTREYMPNVVVRA